MTHKYRLYSRLALLAMAIVLAVLFLYLAVNYVNVEFRLYPRDAERLDLTGQSLTVKQFDKLQRKLPHCHITWDVPLSGGSRSSGAQKIAVSSLTEGDVALLSRFPALQEVDARDCQDYDALEALVKSRPELKVSYFVELGGRRFAPDVQEIEVQDVPREELSRLGCLPKLESVICAGGEEADALLRCCHDAGIAFSVRVGDQIVKEKSPSLQAEGATEAQLRLLPLLAGLKRVYLTNPQAEAQALLALREQMADATVDWERELCGVLCTTRETQLDISEGEITLEALEKGLAFFPDAQSVYLGACGIDNEELAAFREKMRPQIKVVWQVQLGKKLTARTDDTSFMPVRENVYYFNDEEAYNLRYCEDMVAVDIGHMSIHNIDFVEFMPNLTYLILAHTQLNYIEPISSCKNLKFLELDWSPLRDLSPLVGCTALEDLNLGMTYASFEPIKEMTWLKNLWVIECNQGVAYQMSQALPDTTVQGSGSATVASGWRRLPNYYAMRDELGMYYMSWG